MYIAPYCSTHIIDNTKKRNTGVNTKPVFRITPDVCSRFHAMPFQHICLTNNSPRPGFMENRNIKFLYTCNTENVIWEWEENSLRWYFIHSLNICVVFKCSRRYSTQPIWSFSQNKYEYDYEFHSTSLPPKSESYIQYLYLSVMNSYLLIILISMTT